MADADLTKRLKNAAELVRKQAAANAAWSRRISASLAVVVQNGSIVDVVSRGSIAPMNSVFEYGDDHPLNYPTQRRPPRQWGPTPHRPFLSDAVDEQEDAALDEIANVIDDWTKGEW